MRGSDLVHVSDTRAGLALDLLEATLVGIASHADEVLGLINPCAHARRLELLWGPDGQGSVL
eukprot:9291471-Alexandrium_andersonii.AAC.1